MLDVDFIVGNVDVVKRAIDVKGVDLDLDRLLAKHEEVKAILVEVEDLRHERNVLSKQTGKADESERQQLIKESRSIGSKLKEKEPGLREKQDELRELLLLVPNIPGDDEPVGPGEESNVELRTWGDKPEFGFEAKDHVELLELHDWAVASIGNLAGSRSYALRGELALLEMSLWRFALDYMVKQGFTAVALPSFAREAALVGTGHFPGSREEAYELEDDLFLSGTSEVGLNYLRSGEILSPSDLPVRDAGFSTCFRREAGAAGKDVRGLLRVHQFYKVEQYVACVPDREESNRWFEALLANAEALVQALELPYRLVQLSTGEMGAGKVRTWDIECWLPSANEYRETHSVAEFYDWQARRADLRYRDEDGKVRSLYTLNNTAIATPRILAQLLEVHQQEDGTVRVPAALQPYMGGVEVLGAASAD